MTNCQDLWCTWIICQPRNSEIRRVALALALALAIEAKISKSVNEYPIKKFDKVRKVGVAALVPIIHQAQYFN